MRVGDTPPHGLASPPLRLALATLAELLVVAALLSALVLLSPWSGPTAEAAGLLAGFGLLAPATLLAGVLESLGRAQSVLVAFALAAGAEAVLRWGDLAPFAGAGLVAGGLVATVRPAAGRGPGARTAHEHPRHRALDHVSAARLSWLAVPAAAGAHRGRPAGRAAAATTGARPAAGC